MPADEGRSERSTLGDVAGADGAGDPATIGRRRLLYRITSTVLALIVGLAVIDGIGWFDVYGPDGSTVRAEGGGYELRVHYPAVTRPALASPFEIVVERAEGFTEPLTIGIDRSYLQMWDENGRQPVPSTETVRDDWILWQFDPPEPPDTTTLSFSYDGRIEAGVQDGRDGRVAVLEGGEVVVQVEFSTDVRP